MNRNILGLILGPVLYLDMAPDHFRFGTALMLGIGYAASIGGVATLIGTPPNAIVFGSRQVTMQQMMKTGIRLNLIGILLISAAVLLIAPLVWNIDISVFPADLK